MYSKPLYPPLKKSDNHTILVNLPIKRRHDQCPAPYPPSHQNCTDVWESKYVKLPCYVSAKFQTADGEEKKLWDCIQDALCTKIGNSFDLENVVKSYNPSSHGWKFHNLHALFQDELSDKESAAFFEKCLPGIIKLAVSLPDVVTGGIPILKQGRTHSITMSQLQVACLMANAFLCTFPQQQDSKCPSINFDRLFSMEYREDRKGCKMEKLKCLIAYFRRIVGDPPTGLITYSRHCLNRVPIWRASEKVLTVVNARAEGTIEDDGEGMMQMDFANKFIGGGVLDSGCVQEEIRFVICPELILSRLFAESLEINEAFVITGCERFSNYEGYASSFKWKDSHPDVTPTDANGRRFSVVVAVDALTIRKSDDQFASYKMERELKKLYAGFSWGSGVEFDRKWPVATGNWGCGAFGGDPKLKVLLQMMAAAECERDLYYFTFGNEDLRNDIISLQSLMQEHGITVGNLWTLLLRFDSTRTRDVFKFMRHGIAKKMYVKETYPILSAPIFQKPVVRTSDTSGLCGYRGASTYEKFKPGGPSSFINPYPTTGSARIAPTYDKKYQGTVEKILRNSGFPDNMSKDFVPSSLADSAKLKENENNAAGNAEYKWETRCKGKSKQNAVLNMVDIEMCLDKEEDERLMEPYQSWTPNKTGSSSGWNMGKSNNFRGGARGERVDRTDKYKKPKIDPYESFDLMHSPISSSGALLDSLDDSSLDALKVAQRCEAVEGKERMILKGIEEEGSSSSIDR